MSRHPERQYLDLLDELLHAPERPDRTGTGTRSVFGRQMCFDLAQGFPLLTTKKLPFRTIATELLWFLSGSTDARVLQAQGVRIWDEWAPEDGDLGPVYGEQMRRQMGTVKMLGGEYVPARCDQVATVLQSLIEDPFGRRHVVSLWNAVQVGQMALPPCHCLFQFYVEADGRLSLHLYQRSGDVFLGVPFNIASYALLLTMFARVLDRPVGRFVHTFGDVHLYLDHVEQARMQIQREPRPLPTLSVAARSDLDSWKLGDLTLAGYDPWPHISGSVSV